MSGNRQPQGPLYRPKASTPGWWCCNRPMVPGQLPGVGEIRICRHCGAVAHVDGETVVATMNAVQHRRRTHRARKTPGAGDHD